MEDFIKVNGLINLIKKKCLRQRTGLLHRINFKGALSGLRQYFATESSLKMMLNAFYFILKTLFVLKILKLLS